MTATDPTPTHPTPTHPTGAATAGSWKAGTASWWAISVVLTALAITVFTGLRTMHTVSEREPATMLLEAVLEAPTDAAIDDALSSADPADDRLDAREDLVAFDVAIADVRSDRTRTVDRAVETRAATLYDDGIPRDPGPSRTVVGLPRRLVSALTAENHDALAGAVRLAGILSAALLGWTLLQGRNDNLLMLPAGALATAWVLTTTLQGSIDLFLGDIAPGSRRAVRILETAAQEPVSQLTFAAASALAAAAVYRILVLLQRRSARRRLARASDEGARRAAETDAATATRATDAPIDDSTIGQGEEALDIPVIADDAVIDLMPIDEEPPGRDDAIRVRRREPLRADASR